MKIFIGGDHAGFALKTALISFLKELHHEVVDKGDFAPVPQDDYPKYIGAVAEEVSKNPNTRGIVIGGSGEGEAIAANKFPRVRAAEYYGGALDIIRLSREHNDANVLSLGARFIKEAEAKEAVKLWLATPFSGEERHRRRIEEIERLKTNRP
ncbi:RpiB/LacA/LacB family sugar-phosphate isomerase [Patescibacteria group bacterium]|nr:RpiB/LacA/LacB family sugar-phosphate isomerase [Patescibacteria group bacterium]